ncbi:putative protoporphyrin ferrochelatase [Medicago truncatula]|uniref:Ferrochelatase n=1 Tax=Medicago truncatula TaxID=3880 RepID=A0A072U0I5_MEDTR|nr:ferrochelatase [Medicago truncatula]RHN45845.1 putative protoporphyrin ferrochelatase [Medicago truncatula]
MPQLVMSVSSLHWFPNIFPERLSSHFKECTIANYRGQHHELQFVQYIMLNSTSLQMITICSPPSLTPQEMLEMQKELSFFPVNSATYETLEEIDMNYKDLALESGINNWAYVHTLGLILSFISDFEDVIIEALIGSSDVYPGYHL